jgi:hypothetical protein
MVHRAGSAILRANLKKQKKTKTKNKKSFGLLGMAELPSKAKQGVFNPILL